MTFPKHRNKTELLRSYLKGARIQGRKYSVLKQRFSYSTYTQQMKQAMRQ